jgi:hypothetical protein
LIALLQTHCKVIPDLYSALDHRPAGSTTDEKAMVDKGQRIERARAEQTRLAKLLRDGHSDKRGIELAISDWIWEELLLQEELSCGEILN